MGPIPKNTQQPDTNHLLAKRTARPRNIRAAHTPLRLRPQLRRQLPQRKRHNTRPVAPATLHLLRPGNRPPALRSRRLPGRDPRHFRTARLVSTRHTRHQIRIRRRRHRQRHTRQKPPSQRHIRLPRHLLRTPTLERPATHLLTRPEQRTFPCHHRRLRSHRHHPLGRISPQTHHQSLHRHGSHPLLLTRRILRNLSRIRPRTLNTPCPG